jgi:hypothetical protein
MNKGDPTCQRRQSVDFYSKVWPNAFVTKRSKDFAIGLLSRRIAFLSSSHDLSPQVSARAEDGYVRTSKRATQTERRRQENKSL